ncbi:caspase family protein [Methylobacterium bullatum]|uniref:Peptidase C14 caspase domain-containing protein n=1 Tax=Methylobacterium bullatum TaxID=570505 RepID=A0A679JRX2_9HYPH|nr:hypothetical protein MBLL_00679 [Methylobacterium bullatum]
MITSPGRRVALIVGADRYSGRSLSNCVADARQIRTALEARGFECNQIENPSFKELQAAIEDLRVVTTKIDICLFYFAGHALEYGGAGFLVPCDYPEQNSALGIKHYAVPVSDIADAMNFRCATSIIVLDACRIWSAYLTDIDKLSEHIQSTGIAQRKWDDTLIAYSTSAGDAASDGVAGRNSRYCTELCRHLVRHDLSIEDCFRLVGQSIIKESGARQRPWYYSSLRSKLSFSDLAVYQLITTYKLPFDADALLYLSPNPDCSGILVAGRESHLWSVNASRYWRVNSPTTDKIVASCVFKNGFATITEDGTLHYQADRNSSSINTTVKHPHGILYNGRSDVILYGMDSWSICRMWKGKWRELFSQEIEWSIHTGVLLSPGRVWLGGSLGHLVDITWGKTFDVRYIGDIFENINSLCALPTGTVLCGGDSGLLIELDISSAGTLDNFQREARVSTSAMRRQSLVNRLDDDRIFRYLFDRESLDPAVAETVDRCLQQCRVMFTHAAPSFPLIVSGNSEGIVEVVDRRDGQTFQRIDAQSGLGTEIHGVSFLSDTELVTLSSAGVVRFYVSNGVFSQHSGPFLASIEEDNLLVRQGLGDDD